MAKNDMNRRSFLKTLGAGAALAAAPKWARAASPAPAKAERPNILLVLSDDHSYPHVGCYNNPDIKTPNLDEFAGQGVRFERAYVASPQCVPSRAAMMTGRSPEDSSLPGGEAWASGSLMVEIVFMVARYSILIASIGASRAAT